MATNDRPTVREIVREAVEALDGNTTNVAVRDWILRKYPGTNRSTIGCTIIVCTVNHTSRVHYPENRKPRIANDERYDFLFRPERGRLMWYEPAKHGVWKIVQSEDGSLGVAQEGETVAADTEEGLPEPAGTAQTAVGFQGEDQLRDYLALNLEAADADGPQRGTNALERRRR